MSDIIKAQTMVIVAMACLDTAEALLKSEPRKKPARKKAPRKPVIAPAKRKR
jgi:hypothetical protein